ncbi:PHF20 protein, partial [Atractosteus spatula]|nr:PHF20 protein [Atractosteus spatula]
MSKTPPNRRGIKFEVGAQLEARDSLKNWYAANIEKIDYEDEKVLIHYRQWSHRYDEWFDWASPYLRPVERVQLRKEGLQEEEGVPGFRVNEKVLASWSDCRFYPAKVLAVNKDASYTVKFFDGVIQNVKGIHVKPFRREKNGGKSKMEGRNKDRRSVKGDRSARAVANGRDPRDRTDAREAKSKEARRSRPELEQEPERQGDPEDEGKRVRRESGDRDRTADKSEGRREPSMEGEPGAAEPMETGGEGGEAAEQRPQEDQQQQAAAEAGPGGSGGQPQDLRREGGDGEPAALKEHADKDVGGAAGSAADTQPCEGDSGSPVRGRRKRGRPSSAAKSPESLRGVLELRKRKISLVPNTPSKRTKLDTVTAIPPLEVACMRCTAGREGLDSHIRVVSYRRQQLNLCPVWCVLLSSVQKGRPTEAEEGHPDCLVGGPSQSPPRPPQKPLNPSSHNCSQSELKPATDSSAQVEKQESSNVLPESLVLVSSDKEAREAGEGLTESTKTSGEGASVVGEQAPVVRRQPHPPNPNKYSREPLYTAIKQSPTALDLDHNTFKCKVPDCHKSFRKAKLLHYHMKYYHGVDKSAESDQSPKRSVQTRASEKQAALDSPKRRRTISASLHLPFHSPHRTLQSPRGDTKAGRLNEKRRTSAPPAVNSLNNHRPSLREKSKENQIEKSNRKQQDKEREKSAIEAVVKDKEKAREKKHRDFLRIKLKKKKKKKKKSKSGKENAYALHLFEDQTFKRCEDFTLVSSSPCSFWPRDFNLPRRALVETAVEGTLLAQYTGSEENIDISRDFTSKKLFVQSQLNLSHKFPLSHKHKLLHNSSPGHNTEKIKVDDEDTLSDCSTDSLLWSEDEGSQDVDVITNPEEEGGLAVQREFEIVRCVCEAQEENDFMIQCEECFCWQHGICMGLLEDSVPEKYTCYICRDPPGQRQSLKYWYDKDWLSTGHMYGLPFLEENYSHQNAKKISATHQLLGDVHRVIEVLNGLQLKMSILQSQAHPDLKLWCQPWKQLESRERPWRKAAVPAPAPAAGAPDEGEERERSPERPCRVPSFQESYITSEHCYQKPRTYYPAVEQRLVVETRGAELGDSLLALEQRYGRSPDAERGKALGQLQQEKTAQSKEADVSKKSCPEKGSEAKAGEEGAGGADGFQQQWQINLLDHIEAVQDEVTHRMDFIERELDVLESWLDYTGELEPPEPLARLPQLKHRIKQLLMELGKVQQIALCCST